MKCHECFEDHLSIRTLARGCTVETAAIENGLMIVLTCSHGCRLRHASYQGHPDIEWATRVARTRLDS